MNQPTAITRFIGTPRTAAVLYVGVSLAALGCVEGAVPWWLALAALCSAAKVRTATQDVRRYNEWLASWQAMGNTAPPSAAPAEQGHKSKTSSSWAGVIVAAVSLVVIPVFVPERGTNDVLREALSLLWCGVVLYLLWQLVARVRRSGVRSVRSAGAVSAGPTKDTSSDVVEWVLPRASSSPTRADALRNLPDYSVRLMAE